MKKEYKEPCVHSIITLCPVVQYGTLTKRRQRICTRVRKKEWQSCFPKAYLILNHISSRKDTKTQQQSEHLISRVTNKHKQKMTWKARVLVHWFLVDDGQHVIYYYGMQQSLNQLCAQVSVSSLTSLVGLSFSCNQNVHDLLPTVRSLQCFLNSRSCEH